MSSKERVLLVSNIFPPAIGGPATFMEALALRLHERGKSVTVVCSAESGRAPKAYPFPVRSVSIANRYRYEAEVRALLAAQLMLHETVLVNGLESYVLPLARLLRRRFILKIVGDSVWERARNLGLTALSFDEFQRSRSDHPVLAPLYRQRDALLRQASLIVTPGHWLREVVVGWGAAPESVIVIPNGTTLIPDLELSAPSSGGDLRALFVGRLTNWKGVETILAAMQHAPNVTLTVCGDGPQLPALVELTHALQLDSRVTFRGRLAADAVKAEMRSAHFLALPSLYEGLSHTLLEALSGGLPVIASDIGGNREVVMDGENGLLVPVRNAAAFREALVRIEDPALWHRLSRGARTASERFSFDHTVQQYAELLSHRTS